MRHTFQFPLPTPQPIYFHFPFAPVVNFSSVPRGEIIFKTVIHVIPTVQSISLLFEICFSNLNFPHRSETAGLDLAAVRLSLVG